MEVSVSYSARQQRRRWKEKWAVKKACSWPNEAWKNLKRDNASERLKLLDFVDSKHTDHVPITCSTYFYVFLWLQGRLFFLVLFKAKRHFFLVFCKSKARRDRVADQCPMPRLASTLNVALTDRNITKKSKMVVTCQRLSSCPYTKQTNNTTVTILLLYA